MEELDSYIILVMMYERRLYLANSYPAADWLIQNSDTEITSAVQGKVKMVTKHLL